MGIKSAALFFAFVVAMLQAPARAEGPATPVPDFVKPQHGLEAPKPPCCTEGKQTWLQKLKRADFSACLTRICGKPGSVINQLNYDEWLRGQTKDIDADVRKRLEPILKRWGEAFVKSDLHDNDQTLAYLAKGEGPSTAQVRRFLGVMNLANAMTKIQSRTLKNGEDPPKTAGGDTDYVALIDMKKTKEALKSFHLTAEDYKAFFAFYQKTAVAQAAAPENDADLKDEYEAILIDKYSKPLREALLAQLEDIRKANDDGNAQFERIFGFALPKSMTKSDEDRIAAFIDFVKSSSGLPLPLVKRAEKEANDNNGTDDIYDLMSDPKNSMVAKFASQDWKRRIPALVKSLRAEQALLKSPGFKKKLAAKLDLCLSNMSLAAAAYPTRDGRAAFIDKVNAIRGSVDGKFKGILSEHTAAAWKESVAGVDLVIPPTREEWLDFAEKYFRNKVAEEEEDDDAATQEIESRIPDFEWLGVTDTLFPDSDKKSVPVIDEIDESCKLYEPEDAVRDYNLTGHNAIVLSAYSMANEKAGPAIVAHELGHSLAAVFSSGKASEQSSKWYEAVKGCVAAWHPEAEEWPPSKKTDSEDAPSFNFEEDFADEVSQHLTGDSTMMGCALVLTDDGKYRGYDPDAKKTLTTPTFLNEDKDDVHSSGPFRALHMYWDAHHEFPAECRASLQKSGLPTTWKDCF